jgi:hypothetical protein
MTKVRRALEQYLRLEASLAELRARLGHNWHFEREGHSFKLSGDVILDAPIEVDFEHLANVVNLALQGKIPADAVEEWATLLLLSDAYAIAPHRDENRREKLLQCIHELASPSIFGGLDAQHLLELKRRCQS